MRALVLGGTNYFGKHLIQALIDKNFDVTIATRGQRKDDFGSNISRVIIDRNDAKSLQSLAKAHEGWDFLFDQICYASTDAKITADAFGKKIKKYILTSSVSVYKYGVDLQEKSFDPYSYELKMGARNDFNYREGKRQAEAYLAQKLEVPLQIIRPPVVLGEEDYTERLLFHVERIAKAKPIYFPNIEARISFVEAKELGQFIAEAAMHDTQGPINAASSKPIQLLEMVKLIEQRVGKELIPAVEDTEENHSPYGVKADWFANTLIAQSMEYKFSEIDQYLPRLIDYYCKTKLS